MPGRPAMSDAAAPRQAGYLALLRAAEANPEEVFTIPGETLAILLRDLENPRRAAKRARIQAA
ncbi:MAG: hypothetical protein ABI306_00040 [Caulobacteraceae bacterium]